MGRGRPRYDDVLTPREWEVLDLLKRGLSNAEIADRLGVTRDTAKFHVSEIITKLGVENREQAASWGGRPRFKFGWVPAFGMLERVGAAAAGAVVVVAALLILWKDPDEPATLLPPGIYVLDPTSGDIAPRVELEGDTVWSFDWSPDGRAFETTGPAEGVVIRLGSAGNVLTTGFAEREIRRSTFDAATGARLNDVDKAEVVADYEPRWLSPDGKTEATLTDNGIEMRDVATDALLRRMDKDVWGEIGVAWSPDSNWLALMSGPYDPQKPAELRVVSRQPGATAHTVSPAVRPVDYSNGQNWMDWAPDSRSLAFVRDGQVWSVEVASGQVTKLASVTYAVLTEPRWSPDGRELAFRSADVASLYVARADGSDVRYVAPGGAASISPDGKRIATRSGDHVWTLRVDGSEPEVIGSFVPTHVEVGTDFIPLTTAAFNFP